MIKKSYPLFTIDIYIYLAKIIIVNKKAGGYKFNKWQSLNKNNMEYIKVSDKVVRFKKEIRNHAFNSIYRLNAKSCDCYTFYYYRLDNGKEAFGGCWDWKSDLGSNNADYFLDLDNNCFYSIFD